MAQPVVSEPVAEFFTSPDGSVWSWYCDFCLRELGADPSNDYFGEPKPCPEHGINHLTRESWNYEMDPWGEWHKNDPRTGLSELWTRSHH